MMLMIWCISAIIKRAKRMVQHKIAINDQRRMNIKLYVNMREIGWEHFSLELIELYPCRSKDE